MIIYQRTKLFTSDIVERFLFVQYESNESFNSNFYIEDRNNLILEDA